MQVIKEMFTWRNLGDLSNGMSADQILRLDPNKKQDVKEYLILKLKIKSRWESEKTFVNLKGTDEIERGGTTRLQ